jgi:hypothetical protein
MQSFVSRAAFATALLSITTSSLAHADAVEPPHRTHVHIDSETNGTVLERQTPFHAYVPGKGGGVVDIWETICSAPCDTDVPTDEVYRLNAPSGVPSDALALPAGTATVHGHLRGRAMAGVGLVGVSIGPAIVLTGLVLYGTASSADTPPSSSPWVRNAPPPTSHDGPKDFALGMMVTGGLLLFIGMGALVSDHTVVTVNGVEGAPLPAMKLGQGLLLTPQGLMF